jgi:hypothetical protein
MSGFFVCSRLVTLVEHGLLLRQGKGRHERPRIALGRGSHPSFSTQRATVATRTTRIAESRDAYGNNQTGNTGSGITKVGGATLSPKTSRAATAWDSSFGSAMSTVFPRRIASS